MAWVVQVLAANLNLMICQELDGRAVFTKQYRCALNRCPACFHMRKHSVFAMRSDLSIGEGQTGDVSPLARPLIEANNQGESFIDGSRRKFQFTGRPISVATQWRRANWRIGLIPRQPIGVQESKVVVEASANCFPGQLAAHRTALKQCVQEKVLGWLQWHALVVNQQRKAFYRPATNFQIESKRATSSIAFRKQAGHLLEADATKVHGQIQRTYATAVGSVIPKFWPGAKNLEVVASHRGLPTGRPRVEPWHIRQSFPS